MNVGIIDSDPMDANLRSNLEKLLDLCNLSNSSLIAGIEILSSVLHCL